MRRKGRGSGMRLTQGKRGEKGGSLAWRGRERGGGGSALFCRGRRRESRKNITFIL